MFNFKSIFDRFLDLFFPRVWGGCGKEGMYICTDCEIKLKMGGSTVLEGEFGEVYIACEYSGDGLIGRLIKQFKYKFSEEVSETLGRIVVDRVEGVIDWNEIDCLVPVPISRERMRWRGFNQAELLSDAISDDLGGKVRVDKNVLFKVKDTLPQAGLNRRERLENLKGAFEARSNVPKTICLVDDVYTTGTTLNECARALRARGAERVFGLVIAKKTV